MLKGPQEADNAQLIKKFCVVYETPKAPLPWSQKGRMDSTLIQQQPVHILAPYFFKIHFHSITSLVHVTSLRIF
jgi:hypothetical protein